jgi:hypothetical protein
MLMSTLGFAAPGRAGKLLTITMPVGAESLRITRQIGHESAVAGGSHTGSSFSMEPIAQVRLGGSQCPVKEATLEGFFVAENLVHGKVVSSKRNEAEATGIVENMVAKPVTAVYVEEGGQLSHLRVGLRMFGESATVDGRLETTLTTGQEWGIFTTSQAEADNGCASWTKITSNLEKFCWP